MSAACLRRGVGGSWGAWGGAGASPQAAATAPVAVEESEWKAFIPVSSGQCFTGCRPGVSPNCPGYTVLGQWGVGAQVFLGVWSTGSTEEMPQP